MKNFPSITVILILVSVLAIPALIQDVEAKTKVVTIPQGASDVKNPIHYVPSELTVSVLDEILWVNQDNTAHTVTSGSFQGGPDGAFNSGILESGENFRFEINQSLIGKQPYYCTIHPWMNGFIEILDPEGLPVGNIAEVGSIEEAKGHVEEADNVVLKAKEFTDSLQNLESAESFMEAAHHYHLAALEFALLDDREKAALYHHEAAVQHHNAAIQYEKANEFGKSVIEHYEAGIHHHFAAVQYGFLDDQKSKGRHLSESLLHKGMAKFGSDYILPPKHQARFMTDLSDISCKEGFEMVLKSTTKEPACVKPSSAAKLIERGWAIRV